MHHLIFSTSARYASVGTVPYCLRLAQLSYCFRLRPTLPPAREPQELLKTNKSESRFFELLSN
ncbi:hypothetical protein [Methanimicrococcus hacksteinii]|uniref:hypothetical protein n=1 Tax=Methanimicrococcus hacksteinii TaxID=3028293 RepID=UPI00298F30AC|nr:hypothetical protein [Methanimicrococcus sp. At1]